MAVRDDVRQLATKKAQAFTPDPNLTPVAPTATIGNRDPSSRKPNKGFKRFMVGPGGDYSDLADPGFYARGLADEANKQVVQPLAQLPSAFDPTADLSMADRISRAGTGALVAADLVTPFVPEGTIANSLRREAMEKTLDREVAGYASRGGGAKYRGVLGVHGSPVSGLTQIEPRIGSVNNPQENVAWFWDAATGGFNSADLMNRARAYAGEAGEGGQIYVARFPRNDIRYESGVLKDPVTRPNEAFSPGRVVGSVEISPSMYEGIGEPDPIVDLLRVDAYQPLSDALKSKLVAAMTPSERRAMTAAQRLPGAVTAKRLADEAAILRARYSELAKRRGDF